jgi:hypothetical protein
LIGLVGRRRRFCTAAKETVERKAEKKTAAAADQDRTQRLTVVR